MALVGTEMIAWTSFSTSPSGNGDPEGITDSIAGMTNYLLWMASIGKVYQYSLNGTLIGHFDVEIYGVLDPESVEFNPIEWIIICSQ